MENDICTCKAKRGDHQELGLRLAAALKGRGKDAVGDDETITLSVAACDSFQLDRKATWNAERGRHIPRMCTLLTGCTVCGSSSVTYHKDEQGRLKHTACPGPKAAAR